MAAIGIATIAILKTTAALIIMIRKTIKAASTYKKILTNLFCSIFFILRLQSSY